MKVETREMEANHHKPPQTTTRIWDYGYSCAGKGKYLSKLWLVQSSQGPSRVGGARCFCEYPSFQILHIYDFSVVVCVYLRRLALYANHHKSPPKRRKYSEFGTMCIHGPVKSMPCLFCVICHVSGRYIDCKYYYLVFRSVRTFTFMTSS